MVWGPNLGINYPFNSPSALVQLPQPGTPDFAALNTNGDDVIDNLDDPYLPYYPGDEYVDWVALSLYWYPDANTGFNTVPPPTYFRDMATSSGPSMNLVNAPRNGDPTRNFYQRFAVERNKPMMIPETAAPYIPSQPMVDSHAAIKEAWYSQILSAETRRELSRILLVNQFEEIKADAGMEIRDWRCAADPAVMNAFKKVLNQHRTALAFGTDFSIGCGGQFKPK